MEDKILKILKIKIDAIKRNIDNLNYLNGELERNNADLEYIDSNLELFKDNNVLNFAEISRDDFDKILLMINSNVSDIFKDKVCNYDGIIYIIEGINKSISLELTNEQVTAIQSFILGMKEKKVNLLETISNLTESKNRLPETDLTVLTNNLDEYNDIVSKFENRLYLTEIDEISDALNFANVLVEEKADVFEYILKYNADIYTKHQNGDFSNHDYDTKEDSFKSDIDFELPTFNYDTVNLTSELSKNEDTMDNHVEEINQNIDDIKFNLDNFNLNNVDETKEELPEVNVSDDLPDLDNFTLNYEFPKLDDLPPVEEKEQTSLNTVELDDIIKKIDAKLKEMEEEKPEVENNNELENQIEDIYQNSSVDGAPFEETNIVPDVKNPVEIPSEIGTPVETKVEIEETTPSISINELTNKYVLSNLNITNPNLDDVDSMLKVLENNNLLEEFKMNTEVLNQMLNNNNSKNVEELLNLIKENLIVQSDELSYTYNLLIETLPILFTNANVYNNFKENIEFYKEKNINIINILDNYRELFIINHQTLVDNYNKVITYGLEINSDNVKYLLYNKNILNNLDYYIEAYGYEKGFLGKEDRFDGVKYIEKNPYKLNAISKDTLLKLRYTSEKGGKIYGKPGILSAEIANPKVDVINLTDQYINSYFNSEYDFVSKDELESMTSNLNNIDMTLDSNINKLDASYKVDELRYNIDNIPISRIKTIRIYNMLKNKLPMKESLIVALTYNSVIKKEEYAKIVNIVENMIGGM